jgi:hypothetical protein
MAHESRPRRVPSNSQADPADLSDAELARRYSEFRRQARRHSLRITEASVLTVVLGVLVGWYLKDPAGFCDWTLRLRWEYTLGWGVAGVVVAQVLSRRFHVKLERGLKLWAVGGSAFAVFASTSHTSERGMATWALATATFAVIARAQYVDRPDRTLSVLAKAPILTFAVLVGLTLALFLFAKLGTAFAAGLFSGDERSSGPPPSAEVVDSKPEKPYRETTTTAPPRVDPPSRDNSKHERSVSEAPSADPILGPANFTG